MVHFTGLLENARHPVGGPCRWTPVGGPLSGDPCKNMVRAGIGGWPGTATGGQIHVVHISHTHPPKEIIQALRKYLLGKNQQNLAELANNLTKLAKQNRKLIRNILTNILRLGNYVLGIRFQNGAKDSKNGAKECIV